MKVTGKYFFSNMSNEVHNAIDYKHDITKYEDYTQINILADDGRVIDECVLYNSLNELWEVLKLNN